MQPAWKARRQSKPCFLNCSETLEVKESLVYCHSDQGSFILWTNEFPLCDIFPQNGKLVSVMIFIIIRGKSSVAIYNTIICLSCIHYRNYRLEERRVER